LIGDLVAVAQPPFSFIGTAHRHYIWHFEAAALQVRENQETVMSFIAGLLLGTGQ
jgi:hypothetical protein